VSVELLGDLEVLLPMGRDDGVGDLLVDVLAAADEFRVLALMVMVADKAFFLGLLGAVEDGLRGSVSGGIGSRRVGMIGEVAASLTPRKPVLPLDGSSASSLGGAAGGGAERIGEAWRERKAIGAARGSETRCARGATSDTAGLSGMTRGACCDSVESGER
jgi:hypothetical protein